MPAQAEIAQAFGVAKISLKRAVKRYRAEGSKGFYGPRKGRGPAVAERAGRQGLALTLSRKCLWSSAVLAEGID